MFLGNTYTIPAISNLPGQGAGGVPTNFMLDIIPGALTDLVGAYSLRKLTATYTGPCCQVQRTDGQGPILDIDFDGTGYIDIQPAIDLSNATGYPFVGISIVSIKTWYDQSGNGNDLIGNPTLNPPAGDSLILIDITGNPKVYNGYYYLAEGVARKVGGTFVIPAGSDITTFSTGFHPFNNQTRGNWDLIGSGFQRIKGTSNGTPQLSNINGSLPSGSSINLNGTLAITQSILNLQTDVLTFDDVTLELENGTGLIESQNNDILIRQQKEIEAKFFVNNVSAGTNTSSGEFNNFTTLQVTSGLPTDDNDPAEFLLYKNDKSSIRADIDDNTVTYYNLP